MNDVIFSILIAGCETLLLPVVYRWLKKRIKRRWIAIMLLVLIALLATMILGTAVSVISYHISKT